MHRSMHGFLIYAKQNNLSMSQLGALLHLRQIGSCAVSDISEDLGVTNAAVSQMLDRLVQNGLVLREEDPKDRRAKRIELTPRGRQVMRGAMEAREKWFGALAATLTEDEGAAAAATLRILTERMTNVKEEGE
ncbi:MAG: MarR family transcriptional regulator [Spirochaetia bacterium]